MLQTSPIDVNASAESGDGLLLGNVLTTALNTLGATPQNLTGLNDNLNAVLAKVVGTLNAGHIAIPSGAIASLPNVLQTLALPSLIAPNPGATASILDLLIASQTAGGAPVDVNLMGLHVTTSNVSVNLSAATGDGQILGNLLYNTSHLLDPGAPSTLMFLLTQLGQL
jgi:hypothetical protein